MFLSLPPKKLCFVLSAVAICVFGTTARGEIPLKSPEELEKSASHIVLGKVNRIYASVEKTADFEHTYNVAELSTTKVRKGGDISRGNRVIVRYWNKRWIGEGHPLPDHYGHHGVPKTGDTVLIYLRGSRSDGYDVVSPNGFSIQEHAKPKWIDLLSDETGILEEHWETTGNWTLKDGVATLMPREGEKGWSRWSAYLWSKDKYRDFDIEFEYKLEQRGNSGFYFRVGDVDDPVKQGIEVQLYDTDPDKPRNKLSDHDSGGIIPGLKPHRNAAKPAGQWNKVEVMHFDDKIVVMLNGVNVNAHDLGPGGQLAKRPRTGWIGFQDHGLPMSLRNIRIRTPSARTGSTVK